MKAANRKISGRFIPIFFVLLPLFLAGCSAADGLFIDCHVFEDNFDQAAETTVTAGEEFTVTLCSMKNRGYRWSEELYIDNPQVVEELSREYERGRSPMGGIPGKEIWTFRALKPGKAVISLEHTQLSGRNTEGVWTYQLVVAVEHANE
jgi:predicted secreted protein